MRKKIHSLTSRLRNAFFTCAGLVLFLSAAAQTSWNTNGNSVAAGNFLGSTNNAPLAFYTNNQERMRLGPTGLFRLNSLAGTGTGFITVDSSGIFGRTPFVADSMKVLTGLGSFKPISSLTGWQVSGSYLNVASDRSLGIGTSTPAYKLDVNGTARVSGKLYIYRIVPLPGDSEIHFGDSSIVFMPAINNIRGSSNTVQKGLGLGVSAYGTGLYSTAIGNHVKSSSTASYAITMGTGLTTGGFFVNNTSYSLAVAFNSDVPTFFVGTANGSGTVGKVGVGTSQPQDVFQVGDGFLKVAVGSATTVSSLYGISYLGFNVTHSSGNWTTNNNGAGNGGSLFMSDIGGGIRIVTFPQTGATNQTLTDADIATHTRLYVRADGRVQIGTTEILSTSVYNDNFTRLTVDGRIMCKDLVVSTASDWPDYVFDSTYTLMPLDSVGSFISQNHHLPGAAGTQSVAQNGISVPQTLQSQQQSMEEMMLYILQLNERVNALEAENARLKGGK